jgi:hypothetical protein
MPGMGGGHRPRPQPVRRQTHTWYWVTRHKPLDALLGLIVGVSGTSLLAPPSTPALGTPPRLVGVTLGSIEFLLSSGKGKIGPAIHTGKGCLKASLE